MFDGLAPQSFLAEPGAKEVGVEMFSMSKTYGMAGWRLGFVVGNAEIVERVNLLADHVRAGVFVPIQEAGVAALTGPQDSVEERRALYEARRERVAARRPRHALGLDVLRLVAAPGGADARADPGRAADRRRSGRGLRRTGKGLGAHLAGDARRAPGRGPRAPRACALAVPVDDPAAGGRTGSSTLTRPGKILMRYAHLPRCSRARPGRVERDLEHPVGKASRPPLELELLSFVAIAPPPVRA